VVRTHPVTGRKALYVNKRLHPRIIIGIPRGRERRGCWPISISTPRTRCSSAASAGVTNAIAFWDNRCAQHRAMWDYWPHTRAGTRVTVKGERPV
jgi:taurine dioxygenase